MSSSDSGMRSPPGAGFPFPIDPLWIAVFPDLLTFNPRRARSPKHLAFGVGDHRCQGEVVATQFVADATSALLAVLPPDLRLHDGLLHRETGISMSVAGLPVAPMG